MTGNATSRIGLGLGWCLFILGALSVYGYGGYKFFVEILTDDEVPWWIKTGGPALALGITLLFLTVLRQRLIASKTDKYNDVEI